jgi:hypothetical protein
MSPLLMPRPSLMKSVPSVHVLGIGVPISCGFRTAFIERLVTPMGPWSETRLFSGSDTSFALLTVAGDVPVKAESPGTDGTVNAFVPAIKLRRARTRIGTAASTA